MTSRTYVIEVRDDGFIAVGELDHVTRSVVDEYVYDDAGAHAERRLSLSGRLVSAAGATDEEARVVLVAKAIQAAS